MKRPKLVSKVNGVASHRNGVSGAPFDVVLFLDTEGAQMVGVVFPEPGHVAVLNTALLNCGSIAFGENSHRGDQFEPELRAAIKARDGARWVESVQIMRSKALEVTFDLAPYRRAHGHAPRGKGSWMFLWNGHTIKAPAPSSLVDAKRWVVAELRRVGEFGQHVVEVAS